MKVVPESELPFTSKVDETLNAVFVTSLTDLVHRNKQNQGNFSLNFAKEPVATLSFVMYLTPNFFLKNSLDEKLQMFDSSGLISYWVNKHADKRFLKTDAATNEPIKLNLDHLHATFCILMIGSGIGVFIFLVELCIFICNCNFFY